MSPHILRGEAELSGPFAKYLVLGLGLLFLGKQVGAAGMGLGASVCSHSSPFLQTASKREGLAAGGWRPSRPGLYGMRKARS